MAALLMAGLLAGCQAGSSDGDSATADSATADSATAEATSSSSSSPAELPTGCTDDRHCEFDAGTYVLGDQEVIPGMRLTLPANWSSRENWQGELNLLSPESDDDQVFFWIDMVAVTSTGEGHGTPLDDVGTSPDALIDWLTTNPDFETVTAPAPATLGGTPMTSVTTKVSPSADSGDPDCPFDRRCADYFTNPDLWGANSYGIGGDEEVTLYIGTVSFGGSSHTVEVALDAPDHASLERLASAARPILDSVRFPA